MTLTLDELRDVLVCRWGVLSAAAWAAQTAFGLTAQGVVDRLAREARFRRHDGDIPYLTPSLIDALTARRFDAPVVQMAGSRWLRLRPLGKGGQGEVEIGCPCQPGKDVTSLVAIKRPNATTPVAALQAEIATLRRVAGCDRIARLVDADEPNGVLATQLIDGPNLDEACGDLVRRLTYAEVVRAGSDVCEALEVVHATGLIHKDLKPANVVRGRDGRAVLIDFGLAEDPTTAALRPAGTPYYIAPEILDGRPPDARADVFSLAATLFKLLAGHPPHFHHCINRRHFRTARALLDWRRFLYVDAAHDCALDTLRPDVPRPLALLVRRGLSTDPAHRQQSVREVRHVLAEVQARLDAARAIEQEVWGLAASLLGVFKEAHRTDRLRQREWDNAPEIADELSDCVDHLPALADLAASPEVWLNYPTVPAALPRTLNLTIRVRAVAHQLREYVAARHLIPLIAADATALLNQLIVRVLEEVRQISLDAVAVAHEWRSILLAFGSA